MSKDQLPPIMSVSELASLVGMPYQRLLRTLYRMHDSKPGDWLFRPGKRKLYVNTRMLQSLFPGWSMGSPVERDEIKNLQEEQKSLRAAQNALAARLRELKKSG